MNKESCTYLKKKEKKTNVLRSFEAKIMKFSSSDD